MIYHSSIAWLVFFWKPYRCKTWSCKGLRASLTLPIRKVASQEMGVPWCVSQFGYWRHRRAGSKVGCLFLYPGDYQVLVRSASNNVQIWYDMIMYKQILSTSQEDTPISEQITNFSLHILHHVVIWPHTQPFGFQRFAVRIRPVQVQHSRTFKTLGGLHLKRANTLPGFVESKIIFFAH